MRCRLAAVLGVLSLVGCGSRMSGGQGAPIHDGSFDASVDARTGTGGAAGVMASVSAGVSGSEVIPVDAGVPASDVDLLPTGEASCSQWQASLAAINERDAARLGLYLADAVIEGTLGEQVLISSGEYARVHITRVHHGWAFMVGSDVHVPMEAEQYAALGEGNDVLLGLGTTGQAPRPDENQPDKIVWQPLLGAARASEAPALEPVIDYQPWKALAGVAVMRIVSQDGVHTTLERMETLAGVVSAQVIASWYAESKLPYPGVASAEHIVTFRRFDADLGDVSDIRPNTPENRAYIESALASLHDATSRQGRMVASMTESTAVAEATRTAWRYNQSELVARSEVSGIAVGFVGGIDRYLARNDVREAFMSGAPAQVVSYGTVLDQCGDRFLYAFDDVPEQAPTASDAFACELASPTMTLATPSTDRWERMPDTEANAAMVQRWVDSAAPLYQLHPADADLSAVEPVAPAVGAVWSAPFPVETALQVGPLVEIAVEAVVERGGGFEVELSTSFSPFRLEGAELYYKKLHFTCGDTRLLEVGARYMAVVAAPGALGSMTTGPLDDLNAAFLVPGLLLPPRLSYWHLPFELDRPRE